MKFVGRVAEPLIARAARSFPAVVITGPRRSGKTTILRRMFPKATYVLLEDPDILARAKSDPRGLLDSLQPPVIFDEIQNVPELFAWVRTRIDAKPREMAKWLFTGSQEAPLMKGVSESMAGRAAILQLLPFSAGESDKVTLLHGGYPEVLARPADRELWFSSYLQTYLERDVRALTNIKDLSTFRRFLSLLASRHGQILNKTDIATPLGVSVPTVGDWLSILEVTGQIILTPPYFENFGKRLIKSPKVYVGDSGLACHLLGIRTQAELDRSPFLGALFEGFVASEIVKSQANRGARRELYYFRDQQGLEVDFLFQGEGGDLRLVECKAAKTVTPEMAKPMVQLRKAIREDLRVRQTVVHRAATSTAYRALSPGTEAVGIKEFVAELYSSSALAVAGKVKMSNPPRAKKAELRPKAAPMP